MSGELVREPTPEERDLEQRRAELSTLEAKLAQRELDLATLSAVLESFNRRYLQWVGMRQQELDRIEAQIQEYAAALESNQNFRPSGSLKQLYRELAKQIHPDLATQPEARARREALMAEVNRAYANGDMERLLEISQEWETSPDSIKGVDAAADLMRTLRQIAQSQRRLLDIESQIRTLEQSDLNQLLHKQQSFEQRGRNLMKEMAKELDQQITIAQQRLSEIKRKGSEL
jgi:DnaJ-domain-containing protein 1